RSRRGARRVAHGSPDDQRGVALSRVGDRAAARGDRPGDGGGGGLSAVPRRAPAPRRHPRAGPGGPWARGPRRATRAAPPRGAAPAGHGARGTPLLRGVTMRSFMKSLFGGRLEPAIIFPYPRQSPGDRETLELVLESFRGWAKERLDGGAIDH